ncbi:hypothetical protein F5Y17DRAFT_417241 [Xylariaceae sp. FL0594]|nr:hypothetical protein F5Y17DRAFT_417241 [Xylariaceae sp. FL0594]
MGFDMRYVLVPAFVGASFFGLNATLLTLLDNGLGAVLEQVGSGAVSALNGAPAPFLRSYTGLASLDKALCNMVGFFAAVIDAHDDWEVTLGYAWGMAQFAAAWTLLLLEAKRAGNRGRLVSWIGTVGLLFQNLTWTVVIPLYLALHLVTSPVARIGRGDGEKARRSLFVYLWDMALIPMSVTIAFVAPAILMSMPNLFHQTAATHYKWIAAWQPFPAVNVMALGFLHYACYYLLGSLSPTDEEGRPTTPGRAYMVAVRGVYEFALTLCAVTHVPLLLLCVMPEPGREFLRHAFPSYAPIFDSLSLRTFVPRHWSDAPRVDPSAYAPGDLAPLAMHVLHYDFYVGTATLLAWAAYLRQTTVKDASLSSLLRKMAFWLLATGPAGATIALAWDRDEVVLEGDSELAAVKESKKTK